MGGKVDKINIGIQMSMQMQQTGHFRTPVTNQAQHYQQHQRRKSNEEFGGGVRGSSELLIYPRGDKLN